MAYKHNKPLKNSDVLKRDVAKCPFCAKEKTLEQFKENRDCLRCNVETIIILDKICKGCGKEFSCRSNDNYRFCNQCKETWVGQ